MEEDAMEDHALEAAFRGWEKTSLTDSGGFLICRIEEGRTVAAVFPLLLVPGGEGSVYVWMAGPNLGVKGVADNILSAQVAAHRASVAPAAP